mgnify:FL=1
MADTHLAKDIMETALSLAESSSWESTHLYNIAEQLDISLEQIRRYYPQKDDIVEAWFDLADNAVLSSKPGEEFSEQSRCERLQHVMMTWFEALAAHKRITGEMLLYKLEFGHVHLQVLGIMRISRTVQWFIEAAQIDSTGAKRILQESGITAVYLATFSYWLCDDSSNQQKTRRFLKRALLNSKNCSSKRRCR